MKYKKIDFQGKSNEEESEELCGERTNRNHSTALMSSVLVKNTMREVRRSRRQSHRGLNLIRVLIYQSGCVGVEVVFTALT